MNVTLSQPVKILALVGLLAALGLGATMFLHGGGSTVKTSTATPRTPVRTRTHLPATQQPATKPKTVTPTTTPTKRAAKTHVARRSRVHHKAKQAAFHGNEVLAQLPAPLQWQLAHHKIVVVSVYNPQSDTDAISVAEAHAGAVSAGAGFLLVSVLDNKVAGILTALLPGGGLLPDPGVLIYRAPGNVAIRIDGFVDRDAVAQAATNALNGETEPLATSTTSTAPAAVPAAAAAPATTGAP